jgi:hypothetical protein
MTKAPSGCNQSDNVAMAESTGRSYGLGPRGPSQTYLRMFDTNFSGEWLKEVRGGVDLLPVFDVYVWENGEALPQVSFPRSIVFDRVHDTMQEVT